MVHGHWRYGLLVIIVIGSLAGLLLVDPIAQDPEYHQFADQRALLGMPNWQNVLSNIPFLYVGFIGLMYVLKTQLREIQWSWKTMFLGVGLVCLGSAYYHWEPNNQTLVWDRLPMTLGFMGLFVAILCEHLSPKLEKYLLLPALGLGFYSVYYWTQVDDLRLYIWVQVVPLIIIPVLMLLFAGNFSHRRYLVYALVCYVLAKVVEFSDDTIFDLTEQWVGGHAIKHLLAALGGWFVYDMLRKRSPCLKAA